MSQKLGYILFAKKERKRTNKYKRFLVCFYQLHLLFNYFSTDFFLRNLLMFSKPWYLLLNKQMFLFSFSQNFLPPSVFSSPTLDKICSSKRKGKNERFLICFFFISFSTCWSDISPRSFSRKKCWWFQNLERAILCKISVNFRDFKQISVCSVWIGASDFNWNLKLVSV